MSHTQFIIDEDYMSNALGSQEVTPHKSTTQDRSNHYSAMAAYSQKKQYDGFEIIDDNWTKQKDEDLLKN